MAELVTGAVLGERFEILGVLGRGGMATVYLTEDRVRGERVALKVLHEHLAHDPAMRARLRREVQTAVHLRHPGALVAHDLHEFDGQLALSMPFHPGRTLSDRVGTSGAMSPLEVRDLALHLCEALDEAHRHGVLHRDITPSNVMLDDNGRAMLTDFGLARLGGGGTRSTGLLGTAGYTAPEVYEGVRADPRSDLYGLGAVLYVAATGHSPFEADHPAGVLQRQLSGTFTPICELNPDLPQWLAETIEGLLVPDPLRRTQGSTELLEALKRGEAPGKRTPKVKRLVKVVLPAGDWTVEVREHRDQRAWRRARRAMRGLERVDAEVFVHNALRRVKSIAMEAVGLPEGPDPEHLLARAVAEEAGLPPEGLSVPNTLLDRRFRLVAGVDRETATHLVDEAQTLGFRARAARIEEEEDSGSVVRIWPFLIAMLWVVFPAAIVMGAPFESVFAFIAATIAMTMFGRRREGHSRAPSSWTRLPLAYPNDLAPYLVPEVREALFEEVADAPMEEPAAQAPPPTRGQLLRRRADEQLAALRRLLDEQADDLADIVLSDLRATVDALSEQAAELADEVDRLDRELSDHGEVPDELGWLVSRLDRLDTLSRAGEKVDERERASLHKTLRAHEESAVAGQALEARLTAAVARLLEIAVTATRTRREILAEPDTNQSADRLARELRTQAEASARAREELRARTAAAHGKPQR